MSPGFRSSLNAGVNTGFSRAALEHFSKRERRCWTIQHAGLPPQVSWFGPPHMLIRTDKRTHFKVVASCELQEKFPTPPSGGAVERITSAKQDKMAPYDSDDSLDEDQDYTETNVLLGYASKDADDDTISRLGGRPVSPPFPPRNTNMIKTAEAHTTSLGLARPFKTTILVPRPLQGLQ